MTARRLFGSPRDCLARVNEIVASGIYLPPLWYDAVRRVPPTVLSPGPHPGRITFPEDRLYPSLYTRIPQLQDEPLYVTSPHEATVGRRVAQRWAEEIERTPGKDEEKAWAKVMQDEELQRLLAAYDKRLQDGRQQPVTAGNVGRFMQRKLQAMGVMRQLGRQTSPQRRREELQRALDLLHTTGVAHDPPASASLQPAADSRVLTEQWAQLTGERAGLLHEGRQWVVPDMTAVHELRFILAPPNPELNAAYHQHLRDAPQASQRSRPLPENSAGDNSLQWAMSHAVAQEGAALRDWIAYCLRLQVLLMHRSELLPWIPYTNCIDAALWRQARVVLRCHSLQQLEGEDIDSRRDEAQQRLAARDGLRDGRPLVYHDREAALSEDDCSRHSLLLAFVDSALARHRFSLEELNARAPPPPPPRIKRDRKSTEKVRREAELAFNITRSQSRLQEELSGH